MEKLGSSGMWIRPMLKSKAIGAMLYRAIDRDGHNAYPKAISEVLGSDVQNRVSGCLTNRIEQDHRGIKQRYYPMMGFGAFESAKRYCEAFDRVRNYCRPRRRMKEFVSLSQRCLLLVNRVQQPKSIFQAA